MENINCLKLGGNKMVLTHIHVNARFYILSPDPFVQATEYTQSYNRYSYCWNNPLKYSDPSGYYTINLDGLIFQIHNDSRLIHYIGDNWNSISSISSDFGWDYSWSYFSKNNSDAEIGTKNGKKGIWFTQTEWLGRPTTSNRTKNDENAPPSASWGNDITDWVLKETFFSISDAINSYKEIESFGSLEENVQNAMSFVNISVGALSTYSTYKGGFLKWNGAWHVTKNAGTSWFFQKKWNRNFSVMNRNKQIQSVAKYRNAGKTLTKAGGILIATDIVLSGELRPSHGINATMLAISPTGIGAIVAGAWFLADFSTMGVNYLFNGEARGLGDMIDESAGTYEMYEGVY